MRRGQLSCDRRLLLRAATAAVVGSALGWPAAAAAETRSEPGEPPVTPDRAWTRLREGNARFAEGRAQGPRRDGARRDAVADVQKPFAALLGCADSRVPIELVFDQGIGDLFVVRVAGNIVTPEELASLEFGTVVLGAQLIVVLGHSGCGALQAALAARSVPGQIGALYQYLRPAVEAGGTLEEAVRANVRIQAELAATASPAIAERVRAGTVRVVGAVYDLASGRVVEVPS